MMRYEGDIYRPPSEANSYILQCTVGCSHNKCTFCGMYKNKKYRVRDLDEILADIRMAKLYFNRVYKVFLADGDALAMDTDDLLTILMSCTGISGVKACGDLYQSGQHSQENPRN